MPQRGTWTCKATATTVAAAAAMTILAWASTRLGHGRAALTHLRLASSSRAATRPRAGLPFSLSLSPARPRPRSAIPAFHAPPLASATSSSAQRGRRGVIRALKWLVAPLAFAKGAESCIGLQGGGGRGYSCAAAPSADCEEGHADVTPEEIRGWAEEGWSSGELFDSHIHVWGDGAEPYPYDNPPPGSLKTVCDADKFVAAARKANVHGALIVQPINYKFDHSYVTDVIKRYPNFFRGMALVNPATPADEASKYLGGLKADGYVGLRFNPYLWEGSMADEAGVALYKTAGELGMSVGVMCFKGLSQHMPDIKALLEASPKTTLIIDHWGFFRQPATGGTDPETKVSEEAWKDLLALAKYPQVHVKVTALFRVSGENPPYEDLKPRLTDLLESFGPERLMWGSDYPYALVNGGYCPSADFCRKIKTDFGLSDKSFGLIAGGNAARIFS